MVYRVSNTRWHLKKAARNVLAATAWASGWLAAREKLAVRPRVRVLTYHRFGESARDPFCVAPGDFDAQMRWLAEHRLAVSLDDLALFLAGEKDLPDGAVLVTVDDGFRSVYTEMLPVLKAYAIPAVAYVTPSLIRDRTGARVLGEYGVAESEPYLAWDELERLAAAGVVIGSHGWTHRSLGRMGPIEARDESFRSRQMLQKRLGLRVTSFAYPYGTRADFSHTTGTVLAEAGYTTALTSQHGAIARDANPLELPRIKIEGGESHWMFQCLCRGAMDGWRLVDRTLSRVQHSDPFAPPESAQKADTEGRLRPSDSL